MTKKSDNKILIRVDASPVMGAGHFIRMLALAQLLIDFGFEVHIATIPHNKGILAYLADEKISLHLFPDKKLWDPLADVSKLLQLVASTDASWVVLDGYHFDLQYEKVLKDKKVPFLKMVDVPDSSYLADIVLNQNYGAESLNYQVEPNTQVLAGLKYLLVRREFRVSPVIERKITDSIHILVSLGGGTDQSHDLNLKIISGLSKLDTPGLSCTLIAGTISEKVNEIETCAKNGSIPIEVKSHSSNMAAEMLKADFAITAGGSTMWELIYMKVPFAAVSLNRPQQKYLDYLFQEGVCVNLGWHQDVTAELVFRIVTDVIDNKLKRRDILTRIDPLINRSEPGGDLLKYLNS
jgi:UDP-2,4-diacetamido-2,4,6-trideoxy-beta-L-altropyranose hydrolase